MHFRRALWVVVMGAILIASTPAAMAQSNPQITVSVLRNDGHPADHEVVLDAETVRLNIPIKIKLEATEFVCLTNGVLSGEVGINSFPGWAGASANPSSAAFQFTIPQGAPGADPYEDEVEANADGQDLVFEVAWTPDDRPKEGAAFVYDLTATEISLDQGPCLPQAEVSNPPTSITVTAPDIVEDDPNNSTSTPDCETDPFLPQCQETTSEPDGDSPGLGVVALIATSVVAAVYLRRRE